MRSRARDIATSQRCFMSARFAAPRSFGPKTIKISMMSRSRPWNTGGGPIAIWRLMTSIGEMRLTDQGLDVGRLRRPELCDDAD